MISINHATRVIYVPKTFLTQLSVIRYELDVDALRRALKDLEDDAAGMNLLDTHRHNTTVLLGGVTFARTVEIINGYTVEFEDGVYQVTCVGANHNLADVKVPNSVSVIIGNSAGLIETFVGGGGGLDAQQVGDAVWGAMMANYTASGSFGKFVKSVLTVGKFLGLK